MDQDSPEHGRKRLIVVRGPFDEDKTVQDVIKRRNEFLLRTGLHEYAQVIHRGAFLARRPFGEQQVRYLRDERKAEDERRRKEVEKLNGKANDTLEGSRVGRQDTDVGPTDTDDIIKLRRKYEDEQFESEGNRGRWQIYVRQNWHVHALVLCCSLGAVIQGMDESAVNGGVIYFEELRTRLTVEQHSYTIRRNSRLRECCAHRLAQLGTISDVYRVMLVSRRDSLRSRDKYDDTRWRNNTRVLLRFFISGGAAVSGGVLSWQA